MVLVYWAFTPPWKTGDDGGETVSLSRPPSLFQGFELVLLNGYVFSKT